MKIISEEFHYQFITMPRFFPINCYLIKEDGFLTLIDCSKKGEGKKIIAAIKAEASPLKQIILTHAHSDHVGDVAEIKQAFPAAEVILSEKEAQGLAQKKRRLTPIPVELDRVVKEGERIGSLLVKETPGHTEGSISLIDMRTNYAFVGDLIQTKGGGAIAGDTRLLFPFPAMATEDKAVAIESFVSLSQTGVERLYCGHGSFLENDWKKNQRIVTRAQQKAR